MDAAIPAITLNNQVSIPQIGLGTWQAADGEEAEKAVVLALQAGYRLIDTAAVYGNEASVGRAIKASGIDRDEIFITTKLWNSDQGRESSLRAFEDSLSRLKLDYIDLYLIHWPAPARGLYVETWKSLERLYQDGRARAIGVSNFLPEHLESLLAASTVTPAVNQIELHPRLQQHETRKFCESRGIKVEAYSPLMRGGELLSDELIAALADKYGKTPAQIVLRWHVQNGLIVIPKSVTPERIIENIDIFDFELAADDMAAIDALDDGVRIVAHPEEMN